MKALKKCKLVALVILCFVIVGNSLFAASMSYSPTSEFFVNDFANILSSNTEKLVYDTGVNIQESTTAQLVIATVPDMAGDDISNYANVMFNKWKIGNNDKDNGILVLISKSERKIRIEVGYGLEGAINDAKAGRIIDDVAIPYLKNNDYDTAVVNIVHELQGIIYNEYGVEGGFDNYKQSATSVIFSILGSLIPIIVVIIILIVTRGRGIFFFGGPFGGGFHNHGGRFRRWWFWRRRLLRRRWFFRWWRRI